MLDKYVLDEQDRKWGPVLEGVMRYNTFEVLVEHAGEKAGSVGLKLGREVWAADSPHWRQIHVVWRRFKHKEMLSWKCDYAIVELTLLYRVFSL